MVRRCASCYEVDLHSWTILYVLRGTGQIRRLSSIANASTAAVTGADANVNTVAKPERRDRVRPRRLAAKQTRPQEPGPVLLHSATSSSCGFGAGARPGRQQAKTCGAGSSKDLDSGAWTDQVLLAVFRGHGFSEINYHVRCFTLD